MRTPKHETIMPIAVAFNLYCTSNVQPCSRRDPIPAPDGSFMWTELPFNVRCPDCGTSYAVRRKAGD
jgi:hypothetical protein